MTLYKFSAARSDAAAQKRGGDQARTRVSCRIVKLSSFLGGIYLLYVVE